jgi:hypothetical protein
VIFVKSRLLRTHYKNQAAAHVAWSKTDNKAGSFPEFTFHIDVAFWVRMIFWVAVKAKAHPLFLDAEKRIEKFSRFSC